MSFKPKRRLSLVKKAVKPERTLKEQRAVLIVEDNDFLRSLFQSHLKVLNLSGHEATNGKEAVKRVSENDYAMILMDIDMPVMDGLESAKLIRQYERKNNKKRVPIIAVTSIADQEACIAAGMDDYMTKPFLIEHLRAVADRWLNQPNPPSQ
jgi:CheY-like chemotaxis protein